MARRTKASSDPQAFPMFTDESLYIGVDIGKFHNVAGFLSRTLLERHQHFENCPAFIFEQSREGFCAFIEGGPLSWSRKAVPIPLLPTTVSRPHWCVPLCRLPAPRPRPLRAGYSFQEHEPRQGRAGGGAEWKGRARLGLDAVLHW
jgi:hypothetical protein